MPSSSSSQNLIANASFEDHTFCPGDYSDFCNNVCPPWFCGTNGTVDYYHECSPGPNVSVPYNTQGMQHPRTGAAYAGILMRIWYQNWREYPTIQLTQPLTADTWYTFECYVSLADNHCGVEQFGVYFSVGNPYTAITTPYPVQPQIETNYGFFSDTANWKLIRGCYLAEGGEQYLMFGNFHNDLQTPLDPVCEDLFTSYYFLDDMSLVEGISQDEPDLILGGPEFACYEFEIVPETDAIYYSWSDGSHDPTLTVTQSGTYALTVSDGCIEVVDSIEVTVAGVNPPVDLGPPEVTICSGDAYDINLDPDLSEYTWSDGSDGPDYSITTEGTYAVTFDDGCAVTTDEITVYVLNPPPPIDLGDDGPLCDGYSINYDFDPDIGDYLWLDGSTTSSYTISGGGTYGLTVTNMCGVESDEIILEDLEAPEIDLGTNTVQLCSGQTYSLELDPDLGEFLWQDGTTSPDYYISNPGHYSVTVTNVCGFGSDYVDVIYTQTPDLDLGPDQIPCPGDTILLDGGGIAGSYLWQDQSTDTLYTVTQAGTYILNVTNSCGTSLDTVNINYSSSVIAPDLGPDISLCPGEEIILQATSPGASYLWSDGSTADTLAISAGGSYIVQVYNACSSYTDTILVSIIGNPPQVDLPVGLSLCQGQALTLDALVTGVAYQWNDMSQNQQLTVLTPGTYSVTVSNACGSDADSVIISDGGPAPFVELGNDVSLCPGDLILLSPVASDIDTWLWQDGSTTNTFEITTAGLIYVAVQNTCGEAFDTLNATLLPDIPSLDLGADTSLCSGQSYSLTINIPAVNILWLDGGTDPNYTITGPGQVFASITNSCGVSTDTLEVTALPDVPILSLGNDQSLCPGEIISFSPGISGVNYLWQDGSTNSTYTSTQEETVILTISNICGMATDTLVITESTQGPQVNLGNDIQVCEGEIITIPSGISGVHYLWQDGSTNSSYTTSSSGTFILEVSNNCGVDTDTIVVDISGVAPVVYLGPDTTLCEGMILTLISNADAITTTQWQDGSSALSYPVTSPGMYSLMESNRCGNDQDTIEVAYLDAPDPFNLGPDTILCPGAYLTLQAPTQAYSILWQDGSNQLSYLVDQQGAYSLQLSNDCGIQTDEINVDVDHRVPTLLLDPLIGWCAGDIITLNAAQPFPADYLWSTGATTSSIEVTTPGVYSIDVIVPCSTVSQSVDIVADNDCDKYEVHNDIYVPNVFSPNGDGINDVFTPSFGADLDVMTIEGFIFDRWGNLVFQSRDLIFNWDGRFHDEQLQPGVFTYILRCTILKNGQEHSITLKGDLTLIR